MRFAVLLTLFSYSLSNKIAGEFSLRAVHSISVSYLTQCQLSFAECHAPLSHPWSHWYHNLARTCHIRAGTTKIFKNRPKVTLMQLTPEAQWLAPTINASIHDLFEAPHSTTFIMLNLKSNEVTSKLEDSHEYYTEKWALCIYSNMQSLSSFSNTHTI